MQPRSLSEYSIESLSQYREDIRNPVNVKDDFKNRGRVYGMLLKSSCWVRLAIIPPALVGATPMLVFFLFGYILNEHTRWTKDPTYDALPKIRVIAIGVLP